jgi:enoyl-CoA hydratase
MYAGMTRLAQAPVPTIAAVGGPAIGADRSAPLMRRTKESLRRSAMLSDSAEAAELELRAQQWSVEQPDFIEAVRRIQREIAERARTR